MPDVSIMMFMRITLVQSTDIWGVFNASYHTTGHFGAQRAVLLAQLFPSGGSPAGSFPPPQKGRRTTLSGIINGKGKPKALQRRWLSPVVRYACPQILGLAFAEGIRAFAIADADKIGWHKKWVGV